MLNRSRLHVGDVAQSVSEAELHDLFSQAGEVETVALQADDATGKHRGFAFIEMKTSEAAGEAIKMFNGYELQGHTLFVYSVPPRSTKRGESKAEIH